MRRALVLLTLALLGRPALADDAVSVELVGTALLGQAKPRLEVAVRAPVSAVFLELERSDGQKVRLSAKAPKVGKVQRFELEQPAGTFHYEGRLQVLFPKGAPQSLPLSFDATLLGPPRLELSQSSVNLEAHTLTLALDRPLKSVQLRVRGDDGTMLADFTRAFEDVKADERVTVEWEPAGTARVLRLDVRATDVHGFFQDLELYPWNLVIPHEDVLFASGKAEIDSDQKPKLEEAFAELAKAVQNYGRFAKVQLFIAGHTDSVGDAAANQALSEARARSIAHWFRSRAKLPISYIGFGESAPLVEALDETPEPGNRRAEYIVAVEPPRGLKWTKLP